MDDSYELPLETLKEQARRLQQQHEADVTKRSDPVERMRRVDQMWADAVDVGELIEMGIPSPAFLTTPTLGDSFVYTNALSLLCGHRKAGKSHVAGILALDCVNAGRKVLYIDYENGAKRIARRLQDLGADTRKLSENLRVKPFPKDLSSPAEVLSFLEDIALSYPGWVIIIDAFRGYGTRTGSSVKGFNPNDTTHMEMVMAPLADACKTYDITVIIIDHPNRMTDSNSAYKASNSAAKEQIADAIYWIVKEDPYTVDKAGSISIQVDNDRDGLLPYTPKYFSIGGQGRGNPMVLRSISLLEVGKYLEIVNAITGRLKLGPANATELVEACGKKKADVQEVREMMIGEGMISETKDGKSNVYRLVGESEKAQRPAF